MSQSIRPRLRLILKVRPSRYALRGDANARVHSRPPLSASLEPKRSNKLRIRLITQRQRAANQFTTDVKLPKTDRPVRIILNHNPPTHHSTYHSLYGQESHPQHEELVDLDCSSPLTYSGALGPDAHILDPGEMRYCQSPEPMSDERGGYLDPTQQIRAGLLDDIVEEMERMVKKERKREREREKARKRGLAREANGGRPRAVSAYYGTCLECMEGKEGEETSPGECEECIGRPYIPAAQCSSV